MIVTSQLGLHLGLSGPELVFTPGVPVPGGDGYLSFTWRAAPNDPEVQITLYGSVGDMEQFHAQIGDGIQQLKTAHDNALASSGADI